MTAILNPAAVTARQQRQAERAAYRAALATAEATEAPADERDDEWDDEPIPYVPTTTELLDTIVTASATAVLAPATVRAMYATIKAATATPRDYLPVLEYARVTLAHGQVNVLATDRYRVHALTAPFAGEAAAVGYVTAPDLLAVVRAMVPTKRTDVSVRLTINPNEGTMVWETDDARMVTNWDMSMDYPPAERFLNPEGEREPSHEWNVNPKFLGDALTAAAAVSEQNESTRVTADRDADTAFTMVRVIAGDATAPAGQFHAAVASMRA